MKANFAVTYTRTANPALESDQVRKRDANFLKTKRNYDVIAHSSLFLHERKKKVHVIFIKIFSHERIRRLKATFFFVTDIQY